MSSTPKPWKAYICQVYPNGAQEIVILLMNEPARLFNYTTNKFIHIDEIGPRVVKEVKTAPVESNAI